MFETVKTISIALSVIAVFITLGINLFKSYGTQLENKFTLDTRLKIDFSTIVAIYFLYLFGVMIGLLIWVMYIYNPQSLTDNSGGEDPLPMSIIYYLFFSIILGFCILMVVYRRRFDNHLYNKGVIYKDKEYFSSIIPIILGIVGSYCFCEISTKRSVTEGIIILLATVAIALLTTNVYLNYHKLIHTKECYLYFNKGTHRIRGKILMANNGFFLVEQKDVRIYIPIKDVVSILVAD